MIFLAHAHVATFFHVGCTFPLCCQPLAAAGRSSDLGGSYTSVSVRPLLRHMLATRAPTSSPLRRLLSYWVCSASSSQTTRGLAVARRRTSRAHPDLQRRGRSRSARALHLVIVPEGGWTCNTANPRKQAGVNLRLWSMQVVTQDSKQRKKK